MTRVAGLTIERTRTGIPTFAHINLRKHGHDELLEDFFDRKEIEARKGGETVPWHEAKKNLDKINQ